MANKKAGDTNVVGRLHDAFSYAVRGKDGVVEHLADFDGPEAVVARWVEARKTDGVITFTGGHAAPGAPLDLWGTKLGSEIAGISAYSPASIGLTEELAKRIADIEQGLRAVIKDEGETGDKVDDLVEELLEKKLLNPDEWDGDEDEPEGAGEQSGFRGLSSQPAGQTQTQATQTAAAGTVPPVIAAPEAIGADFVGADEDFA